MKFPTGEPILYSRRAELVNFENLLSIGKRDRGFQYAMLMTIEYIDATDILLFKKGELYKIFRETPTGTKEIELEEVKKKIGEVEFSIVNLSFIEDALFSMINAGFQKDKAKEVDGRIYPLDSVFQRLKAEKFTGLLMLEVNNEERSYISMVGGEVVHSYLADHRIKDISEYLKDTEKSIKLWIFEGIPTEAEYATPAQVKLMLECIEKIITSFGDAIGTHIVRKFSITAKMNVVSEFPFLDSISISEDLKLTGFPRVKFSMLSRGFASFVNQLVESLIPFCGGKHLDILRGALRDYRFALDRLKFFDFLKYSLF